MPLEQYHWLPRNHLEVLEGHPERNHPNKSLIRRYFYPVTWGLCTLGGSLVTMVATRRPIMSGIQIQIGAVALGTLGGELYGRMKERYYQEQEARLKYYVQTHRELFPDYEMIKIGDILEPWIPVR